MITLYLLFTQWITNPLFSSFLLPFCHVTHSIFCNIHFYESLCTKGASACVPSVTLMFLHDETSENSGQVGGIYHKVLANCNISVWQ